MGKASKWFKSLLGIKSNTDANQKQLPKPPPKKKWGFTATGKKDRYKPHYDGIPAVNNDDDASKHAIAVATATAAVAEAAVAAAQAAAAVVQLTSSGRNISVMSKATPVIRSGGGCRNRVESAAVAIQSHFRAYLSRRALRALKALVKLQALVRGHLVRKQTAYALQRLQVLVRAQGRARAGRLLVSESPHSSMKCSHFSYPGPSTPEKLEHITRGGSSKNDLLTMPQRNSSKPTGSANFNPEKSRSNRTWMDNQMCERVWEQGSLTSPLPADVKILEVDTAKLHLHSKRRGLVYSSHLSLGSDQNCCSFSTSKDSAVHQSAPSPSSGEVQSLSTMNYAHDFDETAYCTANNSPTFHSASSKGGYTKRGAFTPAKSDGTRSCLSGYSDHPNYMANTQSSRAKLRSVSAPKQRLQFDRSYSTKRYSLHAYGDAKCMQKIPSLHANKAYPGSGHLDKLGMPIRGDFSGFSGGHGHRF